MRGRTLIRKTSLLRKIEPIARRSSFANRIIYNPLIYSMNERRNDLEIVIVIHELLRRSQTRIDLLFTMSEIPHACPVKDNACEVMFRGRCGYGFYRLPVFALTSYAGHASAFSCVAAPRVANGEAWWSQTGSNRRPHACKARALPAELWPRILRRRTSSPHSASKTRVNALYGLCRARFTRLSCVAAPRVANGEAWWAWEDLNFRPHAYQARALTN